MADVHIVGAGPAGSIAAISATRNGHSVIVSEDHAVSGLPENCSGLFSVDGLESLKEFIDYKSAIMNRIYGAQIHFSKEALTIRSKDPVANVCDRAKLDSILASNAENEGVKINYSERIAGNFHAENIIGADGPLSHVARNFKFPPIKKFAATLQADIEFNCEQKDIVEVFFSNEKFPGFFAWVIPHNEERAEFGVGVEVPARALSAWKNLLKLKGIDDSVIKPTGATIPLETRSKTGKMINGKNVLLVGDAAGQVKSTTGGGVIFGGNCAALAGKYACEPGTYEKEWRSRYGTDLAIHKILHQYLASRSDASLARLGRRLKKLNIDEYLSKNGDMDKPTKMIKPNLFAHVIKSIIGN
jgi:geranylgeranyl reductase family protein